MQRKMQSNHTAYSSVGTKGKESDSKRRGAQNGIREHHVGRQVDIETSQCMLSFIFGIGAQGDEYMC